MEKFVAEEIFGGLKMITPTTFADGRGCFAERYNQRDFGELGIKTAFVQDNESWSRGGVVRGLHFQKTKPQEKLVRVAYGKAFDVAVDLRQGETQGKWFGVELSAENGKQLYIPKGFAHGFLALSEWVCFCYKVSDYFDASDEDGIAFDDPTIGVDWPKTNFGEFIVSEKDRNWGSFLLWKRERSNMFL